MRRASLLVMSVPWTVERSGPVPRDRPPAPRLGPGIVGGLTVRRNIWIRLAGMAPVLIAAGLGLRAADDRDDRREWTSTFLIEQGDLVPTGRNPYLILEPGYQLVYQGKEGGTPVALTITVLDETKPVGNVVTRVVEERETKDGQPVEISRNFFAICKRTNNVYYFGEDVDIYKDGQVVGHEGAWLDGRDGARFGLAMPGSPLLGARYQQEIAPGKAMDRAEVLSLSESLATPAGTFANALKTEETTPLEPGEKAAKYYAAGVGLLTDGTMKLVRHGFVNKK
jgi:hypothetical protein